MYFHHALALVRAACDRNHESQRGIGRSDARIDRDALQMLLLDWERLDAIVRAHADKAKAAGS